MTIQRTNILALLTAALLAFASSTQADELVVATGDIVAGKELTYAASPAINDASDVVFQGIWTNDSGQSELGVFLLATDGTEALLAASGDIVAGKELHDVYSPAINDAGDVVFRARWTNDAGQYENGVFLLAANGTKALLAARGDVVAGKELHDVYYRPDIDDAGDLVFEASWRDDSGRYEIGIFLLAADGTEALLAATGDVVAGKELTYVVDPANNNAGDVLFEGRWAIDSGGYELGVFLLAADGTEALLAGPGDIVAGKELNYAYSPTINDAGDMVFGGGWTNDSGENEYGAFLLAADGMEALLAAPSENVAGKELTNTGYPSINDAGDVVFDGYWTNDFGENERGVLLLSNATAVGLLEQLILDVDAINARNGVKNSLDSKLDNALDSLEAVNADQRQDSVNKMDAFINSVDAQRSENISDEEADFLIDSALEIIRLIGA